MSIMKCSICGLVPEEPVVSARSGLLFEKRLIERHIMDHGKCPITGYPLTLRDLITLKTKQGVYKNKSFAQETRDYLSFVVRQSRVPHYPSPGQEVWIGNASDMIDFVLPSA